MSFKTFASLSTLLLIFNPLFGQWKKSEVLSSGPLLGYAEMREAVVWIQGHREGFVYMTYSDGQTTKRSQEVYLEEKTAFTAKLLATGLEDNTTYDYTLYFDDKAIEIPYQTQFKTQAHWMYRFDPPSFTMATGSCSYFNETRSDRPGRSYGGAYEIFPSIVEKKPDLMLWLGDNVYLRPSDWTSRSGYIERYTHDRAVPELQELLASCQHFAIWDDHDFGPNDAGRFFQNREVALEIFDMFWPNPVMGFEGNKGVVTSFQYNDIHFFLLDNRYYRTQKTNKGANQILGKDQIEWLIQGLSYSEAPFKIVAVGGQVLNSAAVYETHAVFSEERDYLLKRISEENIDGVIFLTGDRHHSEISKMTLPNGKAIYDITVSPLTSGANQNVTEVNKHRVEGTLIQKRNFATLDFAGPRKSRTLTVKYFDGKGEEILTYTIE
ncbi:MAG: alkaline phosphatase family protein [Cryomorphaceae bacterium]|nr:alkaline phosphatase family protein [Cryomorphaceae bacterium]